MRESAKRRRDCSRRNHEGRAERMGRIPNSGLVHNRAVGSCEASSNIDGGKTSHKARADEAEDVVDVEDSDRHACQLIGEPEILELDENERRCKDACQHSGRPDAPLLP